MTMLLGIMLALQIVALAIVGFIASKIAALEKNTNSKMDQLLAVTKESSHAEGVRQERDAQRTRP